MNMIEELASAALRFDTLALRSIYQEIMREPSQISSYACPQNDDARLRIVAAALLELMAERSSQHAPAWTAEIGALSEPLYLVPSASRMKHLRALCEIESPGPLRRRHLYAPPNFLEFVCHRAHLATLPSTTRGETECTLTLAPNPSPHPLRSVSNT